MSKMSTHPGNMPAKFELRSFECIFSEVTFIPALYCYTRIPLHVVSITRAFGVPLGFCSTYVPIWSANQNDVIESFLDPVVAMVTKIMKSN